MVSIKSRVSARLKTTAELDEIIAVADSLSQEIRRKAEPRPEHLTRMAKLIVELARHVQDLQQQQREREEEAEGISTN